MTSTPVANTPETVVLAPTTRQGYSAINTQAVDIAEELHIPNNDILAKINRDIVKLDQEINAERERITTGIMWIRGYTVHEIANSIGVSKTDALRYIRETRAEFAQWHKDEIESIRAERIESLRNLAKLTHNELDAAKYIGNKAQLLSILVKIEEQIARLQGVDVQKIQHSGEIDINHKKLYDFDAKHYPQIIDAEVREVSTN